MFNIKKVFNVIANTTFPLIYIIIAVLFACSNNYSASLYRFANEINDYYKDYDIESNGSPILRIKQNDKNDYYDLHRNFYYCDSLSYTHTSFRQFNDSSVKFECRGTNFDACLCKQYSFSIGDKYEWGYYLDSGLFSTYFKDEILPNRGYLGHRYNSDGFTFISDTLADKLCSFYGIDSYEELISNQEYCLLTPVVDGIVSTNPICINNILHSDYRTGPRVNELYGDFAIYYGNDDAMNSIDYTVEMDLRSGNYGTVTLFRQLCSLGYNSSNTDFSIFKKDASGYHIDSYLSNKLKSIAINTDLNYLVFPILSTVLFNVSIILLRKKISAISLIIISLFFLGYSVMLLCVYIPPINNVFSIISGISSLMILLVKAWNRFHYLENNAYAEINI